MCCKVFLTLRSSFMFSNLIHPLWCFYFYTCLLSHLMKRDVVGEKLFVFWWNCLASHPEDNAYYVREGNKRKGTSCPWVKGNCSSTKGEEIVKEIKKVSTQKRINYTIFYVTSYIAYYGFGILRIKKKFFSFPRMCGSVIKKKSDYIKWGVGGHRRL
jgi:hypothetical protein